MSTHPLPATTIQRTSMSTEGEEMARAAAKLEREITRLEEIDERLARDLAEVDGDLARLSAEMVPAMAQDNTTEADRIEREAQAADSRRTSIVRRRDSVRIAIDLMKDELSAVRTGDTIRATKRQLDGGEMTFDGGQKQISEGVRLISAGLGAMLAGYTQAKQAADELVELGEERPGLYSFDPRWSWSAMQRLRDEAVTAAVVAVGASQPEFKWTTEIGAAVPTAS